MLNTGLSGVTSMQQRPAIQCDAYQKNDDGTWTSIRNNDLQTPIGSVRINPGIVFKPGRIQWGIDVVKTLEDNCPPQV